MKRYEALKLKYSRWSWTLQNRTQYYRYYTSKLLKYLVNYIRLFCCYSYYVHNFTINIDYQDSWLVFELCSNFKELVLYININNLIFKMRLNFILYFKLNINNFNKNYFFNIDLYVMYKSNYFKLFLPAGICEGYFLWAGSLFLIILYSINYTLIYSIINFFRTKERRSKNWIGLNSMDFLKVRLSLVGAWERLSIFSNHSFPLSYSHFNHWFYLLLPY